MRSTIPELKRLRRGDTAIIGCDPSLGEIEWTVLDSRDGRLLLLSRRPLKGEWLSQHGGELTENDLNRMLDEKWLPEWMDWIEQELVCAGPERKFLPCASEPGIRPIILVDLSRI